jgi:hypothetical protein
LIVRRRVQLDPYGFTVEIRAPIAGPRETLSIQRLPPPIQQGRQNQIALPAKMTVAEVQAYPRCARDADNVPEDQSRFVCSAVMTA